ncbi:MAG: hypothetical protein P4L34_05690 [Paludibacter sp.]|nr:hypothetical protein [Paludibacter sp.]
MEKMSELIEKYFRGETTLAEEITLNDYFKSGDIKAEHVVYQYLFEAFDLERNEKIEVPLKTFEVFPSRRKNIWLKTLSYSGIAAALVFALWIQRPHRSDDFAIISGKRIENQEYVKKYATAKLNKVNDILRSSMEPLQSLNKVKKAMKPLRDMPDLKNETTE